MPILKYTLLTLKLLRDRSKFKIKYCFPFLSKLLNLMQMFSVAIHSHFIKENVYKFKIPRANQHSVYFLHSNLKVGLFGPPPSSLWVKQPTAGRSATKRPCFESYLVLNHSDKLWNNLLQLCLLRVAQTVLVKSRWRSKGGGGGGVHA